MTGRAPAATYQGQAPVIPVAPAPARPAGTTAAAPPPPRGLISRLGRSLLGAGTPAALRLLMITLILGSLTWGAVGAWTVSQHASAAREVVSTSEPLSLAAQQMYQSLSDADVTATTAFLAGPPELLSVRQRYEADIAGAAASLATLRIAGASEHSAGGAASGSQLAASLTAISAGLPLYTGYVEQAQTYSSLGYPLTGGSFMQVASEEMHLALLPAASAIYSRENAALTAASAQATGLPWIVIAVLIAIGVGIVLFGAQRWLHRRTHRRVNHGLLAASVAVLVVMVWLAVAFVTARSDFEQGLGHGSAPAESLAQAGIAAQEARGDEVLNLISRSGATSFQQDYTVQRHRIGPGSGSLLDAAASASPAGAGASAVSQARRDAASWYAASGKVFALDLAANYAAETRLVIGTGTGSSAAGFARLEADLSRGIAADQVVFRANAAAGSDAFGALEAAVILAALLMAAGSAWGISRRLAEYR